MISIEQINGEIAALESEKPTFAVMERLADLYVVRDHMGLDAAPQSPVPVLPDVIPDLGLESDFARAIEGKNCKDILMLMNELMITLQALNPKLYQSVMNRL